MDSEISWRCRPGTLYGADRYIVYAERSGIELKSYCDDPRFLPRCVSALEKAFAKRDEAAAKIEMRERVAKRLRKIRPLVRRPPQQQPLK